MSSKPPGTTTMTSTRVPRTSRELRRSERDVKSFSWVMTTFWIAMCASPKYNTRPTPVNPRDEACTRKWAKYIAAKRLSSNDPPSSCLSPTNAEGKTAPTPLNHGLPVDGGEGGCEIGEVEVVQYAFSAAEDGMDKKGTF